MAKGVVLIGYSGHSFVVADIFEKSDFKLLGYCDSIQKEVNPFALEYLGSESSPQAIAILKKNDFFISIGSNHIRSKVYSNLKYENIEPINAIHHSSVISSKVEIGKGVMIAANVIINALAEIKTGAICNTGCIIEHECRIGNFAHIAPGTVLAGNVTVGDRSFIGANSVVKQGITIGKDVTVGAGAVILKDIPNGAIVVGNPGKIIKQQA
jgi:sugar O-acyltransferase (sialic acid O-acetyltransferase NeuD family)